MEKYIVNFLADVDMEIKANPPEEAKRKARELYGEYYDRQFDYVYLSEIKFVTTADGKEV